MEQSNFILHHHHIQSLKIFLQLPQTELFEPFLQLIKPV